MSITAKELAKIMGLSESAVSLALNGKPGVSTKTREQVRETAEKYGYDFTRVSGHISKNGAIYLATYRKHGAVVTDTPFFSEVTEGVRQRCRELGYKLNMIYLDGDDDSAKQAEEIRYSDCIGLILIGTEMTEDEFAPFDAIKIPIVLLDVYLKNVRRDCVLINNVQGAFQAVNYLISRTLKQPGYLQSSYSIGNFEERADGFYRAIRSNGMSASKTIVHRLPPSIDGAFADMMEILERGDELAPCYFADNDLIAIGAMRALQTKGYRIPEDISVIGFDNLPMASYLEPGLTTVNVPKRYMGELAVSRLTEDLRSTHFVPIKIEVGTNIVKRRSL